MTIRHGILPYDTTDSSVVFRCPLTSLASITDIGGTDLSSGSNLFDSTLGMRCVRGGNSISGIRFRTTTMSGVDASNLPSGQMSIEVQRAALAIPSGVTDSQSDGYDNGASHMAFLYWIPDNQGANTAGYFYKRSSANGYDVILKAGQGATASGSKYIASNAEFDEFCTVTVSWDPSVVRTFIDGFLLKENSRVIANNPLTQFQDIFIGNYGNTTTVPSWNAPYYMRNFILSSRPVRLNHHPVLAHIMSVGDSFAGGQYLNTTTTTGEAGSEVNLIAGRLAMAGFTPGSITVYSNGGSNVLDAGADPMQDDINAAGKTRAAGAGEFPTFVIFQGGVNDAGQDLTDFLADLKDHVNEWMADGTTYTANYRAKRMILVCQVSGTSISAGLTNVHNYIKQIPDWWDETYPSRAGQVQYVDMVPHLTTDGSTVNTAYYLAADPVHPNSVANVVYARVIADKMLQMLEV